MIESQSEGAEQKPQPPQPNLRVNLEGSLSMAENLGGKSKPDGSLLDSALFNLNIAQQYIDESKHRVEHRLVCFHYAIALLARYRADADETKIGLARQYFLQAASWDLPSNASDTGSEDAHDRIVCEAFYNLGVIDELRNCPGSAESQYARAIEIATKRKGSNYGGVEILAGFSQIAIMRKRVQADDSKRKDVLERIKVLRDTISWEEEIQGRSAPTTGSSGVSEPANRLGLRAWLSRFRAWGVTAPTTSTSSLGQPPKQPNATLDSIRSKLDEFERELGPAKSAPGSS